MVGRTPITRQLEERDEEPAARAANREMIAQMNRAPDRTWLSGPDVAIQRPAQRCEQPGRASGKVTGPSRAHPGPCPRSTLATVKAAATAICKIKKPGAADADDVATVSAALADDLGARALAAALAHVAAHEPLLVAVLRDKVLPGVHRTAIRKLLRQPPPVPGAACGSPPKRRRLRAGWYHRSGSSSVIGWTFAGPGWWTVETVGVS
jgi:hypothetical protein